ncbi:hypothetical protein [Ketobacter sp.]|uniref:hypothetical protein n=1 Tax=Ketobacter sp. TaxID=2083498 RepID=UPI000F2B9068|nr:hypothetical protein [Ketobacter sp.]RLT92116.1 MAG: hypothetical protein D9N14_21590 [Ketobacter sp.]
MNLEPLANFGLKQLDTAGYYLSRYGITDQVNRHNLIAIAMTEKERLLGEVSRFELRYKMQKRRLEQLRKELDGQLDELIARTPKAVAERLYVAKNKVNSYI